MNKSANSPPSDRSTQDRRSSGSAYLFTQNAGRFSDVFRLTPPGPATMGRSRENPIVVRSEQASRRHAEVAFDSASGQWRIRDLGSRNGTFVNARRIEGACPLQNDDEITIAGYSIRFHHELSGISHPASSVPASGSPQASGANQATAEFDPASIAHRIQHSGYLDLPPDAMTTGAGTLSSSDAAIRSRAALLKLSFDIGRSESIDDALELALQAIEQFTAATAGGIYRLGEDSDELLATFHPGGGAYRGVTPAMRDVVARSEDGSILARNLAGGDPSSSNENSLGQIDVETVILAAIDLSVAAESDSAAGSSPLSESSPQSVSEASGSRWGILHLITAGDAPTMGSTDLQFAVAVAQVLAIRIESIEQHERLARTLRRSRQQVAWLKDVMGDRVQLIGRSESIATVIEQVRLAAPTGATVLVRGESGVGKELVASAIHHASGRSDGPLVCMNCAALSPALLESELFGHEKGAFTGATDRKRGKFELAHGGTLLLDEIGEMSAEIQAKFLRVLEGHPFERVGGHEAIRTDVRVVAATHRDLRAMVAAGEFRQDLYYRLHVVDITVPPLRDRGRDVLLLAEHFLQRFAREMGRPTRTLSDAAQKRLSDYPWPGNIRELRNVMERAVVLSQSSVIDADDLVLTSAQQGGASAIPPTGQAGGPESSAGLAGTPIDQSLAQLERAHIERVLNYTEGNKSRASAMLGIERSTLDRKLKRYRAEG